MAMQESIEKYGLNPPCGTAIHLAETRIFRVDMVGAIGSIPIPPTIQIGRVATDLNAKPPLAARVSDLRAGEAKATSRTMRQPRGHECGLPLD